MEDFSFKYMFYWGPLMIFFFAVGWGLKTYGPILFSAWSAMLKETVSALKSASTALENSTRAIEANNFAMNQHHETVMVLHRFIDDMKSKMEDFQCPAAPRTRRRANAKSPTKKATVRIVDGDRQ